MSNWTDDRVKFLKENWESTQLESWLKKWVLATEIQL